MEISGWPLDIPLMGGGVALILKLKTEAKWIPALQFCTDCSIKELSYKGAGQFSFANRFEHLWYYSLEHGIRKKTAQETHAYTVYPLR
jgi:hypothetical protein